MTRQPDTLYLDPRVLVENFSARSTPLDGIRRFYAREGLVVFADDKSGMTAVAGDIWLRPAATRRIGSYLDLQKPAIVGFVVDRDSRAPARLPETRPEAPWDEFLHVADDTRDLDHGGDRNARLVMSRDGVEGWGWSGAVAYEYVQRLARGQRTIGHAEVELHARKRPDGAIDVAVLLNRSEDLEVATRWLRWAFSARERGFHVSPVTLPETREPRLASLHAALRGLNDGMEATVASPGFHRLPPLLTEVTTPESDAGPSEKFIDVLRSSSYRTDMTSVDVVAGRQGVDDSAISALNVYLRREEPVVDSRALEEVVIALRLRQVPRRDAHLTLAWHAGKAPNTDEQLTRETWDAWPSLTWDLDRKRGFLLRSWDAVMTAMSSTGDSRVTDAS